MKVDKTSNISVFYTWVKQALEKFNKEYGTSYTIDRNVLGEGKHPREPQVHISNDGTITLEYEDAPNTVFSGLVQPYQEWAQEKYMTSVSNKETYNYQLVADLKQANAKDIQNTIRKHGERVALEVLAIWDDGNGYITEEKPWSSEDNIYETDEYVLSYNDDYVQLQRKIATDSPVTKTAQDDMFHPPAPQLNTTLEDDIPPMEWTTDSDETEEMSDEEKEDEKYEEINEQVDELEDEAIKKIEDEFGLNIKEDADEELMEEVGEAVEEAEEEQEDDEESEEDEDEDEDEELSDKKEKKRPSDFESSSMEVF